MAKHWRIRSFLDGMARTFGITGAPTGRSTVSEEQLARLLQRRGRKAFRVAPSSEMPLGALLLRQHHAPADQPIGAAGCCCFRYHPNRKRRS